jgi:putative FmdB family regulatory protein
MPIYEYRCSQCGHELEALQRLADAPLKECPSCRASALVKKVSAAGFQLKGSGWYATDFRGGGTGKPAESGDASKGEAKADAKADVKSEAKADTTASGETAAAKKSEPKASSPAAPATRATDTGG